MSKNKVKKRVREEGDEAAAPADAGDSTSAAIGAFHTLFKQRSIAKNKEEHGAAERGIQELGGMAAYQQLSLQMGFDASGYVIEVLAKEGGRHAVLDVGAIVHRYPAKDGRVPPGLTLQVTSIDLHSQDPLVKQADFFQFAKTERNRTFDAIVLSLVLNYVSTPIEVNDVLFAEKRLFDAFLQARTNACSDCQDAAPRRTLLHCAAHALHLQLALFEVRPFQAATVAGRPHSARNGQLSHH